MMSGMGAATGGERRIPWLAVVPRPIACVHLRGVPDGSDAPGLAIFAELLGACREITPRVEAHPAARVAVLDLAGCERLLVPRGIAGGAGGGAAAVGTDWTALAVALAGRLRAVCPGGRLVVSLAPGRAAAWLAASWLATPAHAVEIASDVDAPPSLALAPEDVAPFLESLPLGALLDLPDLVGAGGGARARREARAALEALDMLTRGGVRTLGQLARIPEVALRRRFGEILGAALSRIASGRDVVPSRAEVRKRWIGAWLPLEPSAEIGTGGDRSDGAFDAALDAALDGALGQLAEHLAVVLRRRGLEAGTVAVFLRAEGEAWGTPERRSAYWRSTRRLGRPTASAEALRDHGRRLLERPAGARGRQATSGRYVAVHLRAGDLRPAVPRQDTCWPVGRTNDRGAARERLLAAAARRGAAALLRADLVAPFAVLPEERYVFRAAS